MLRILYGVLIIGLLLGLAACLPTVYSKMGATAQQFQADQFQCEAQVVTMYGGMAQMGIGGAIVARGDIHRCLQSKGWR